MSTAIKINENACQICGSQSRIFDVVDFNKSCEEVKGKYLELCGLPIYYYQCTNCKFTFSPEIQNWSRSEFLEKIYNEAYVQVDPDYYEARPHANYVVINNIFGSRKFSITHIDYGGGNGKFSALLRTAHWNSTSYDPLIDSEIKVQTIGKFDFITAFEVFEHVPRTEKLMFDLVTLAAPQCLILFSTLLIDENIAENQRLTWWYASPRNGHISLFSRMSLKILAQRFRFEFFSFSDGLHCFHRDLPQWALHIVPKSSV